MTELTSSAYVAAFQETRNPAILADDSFIIRDVNEACLDMTGYTRDELIGETPAVLIKQTAVFDDVLDALSNNEAWTGTFELATKHDHTVYGHGTATPIIQDGELIAYAGFWVDMSNQRRYEHTLRILNRVLRHNLRNDANVILGHIDSVREQLDDPQLVEQLQTASTTMQAVVSQAETARNLESLVTEKAQTANEPLRIDTLLAQITTEFQSQFPDSDITFTNAADHDVYVLADNVLEDVFAAIVENAIEHNDKETPEVDIRLEEDDQHVTVFVGDNGPGIPEAQREQVFGREETDQVQHGQGLSLFFVDQMIQKYKGDIWIDDNEPTGSVFVVELQKPEVTPDPASSHP